MSEESPEFLAAHAQPRKPGLDRSTIDFLQWFAKHAKTKEARQNVTKLLVALGEKAENM